MLDSKDHMLVKRPDNGYRTLYRYWCNNCGADRGYKRAHKDKGLCQKCAMKSCYNYSKLIAANTNVDFGDYIDKLYSGKNRRHFRTKCSICGKDRGYLWRSSWRQHCRQCRGFSSEDKCRTIIERLTGHSFPSVRPDFLKNPETNRNLELDGYCEELKLAFEYQGRLHFQEWNKQQVGKNKHGNLNYVQDNDLKKKKICDALSIILIVIPYTAKDLDLFIKNALIAHGVTMTVMTKTRTNNATNSN